MRSGAIVPQVKHTPDPDDLVGWDADAHVQGEPVARPRLQANAQPCRLAATIIFKMPSTLGAVCIDLEP